MALREYVGAIVVEVDGRDYDVESLDIGHNTGRKLVKTMGRQGHALGFARGVATYDLKLTVAIPANDAVNWADVEGAKVTVYPHGGGGQRKSYLDCFVTEAGEKYSVDNEAKIDITMMALREVVE